MLPDGAGQGWLRFRRLDFDTEDGTPAWRYVRNGWSALDVVLQQASSGYFSSGIWEVEDSADTLLELTAWVGGTWAGVGDGNAHSVLLVSIAGGPTR